MRLNQIFLKSKHHARAPQNERKVPLKVIKPLVLQNKVTGNAKEGLENKCLFEMTLLFKCWAENEFNDKACDNYMKQLQKCHKTNAMNAKELKSLQKPDIPIAGSTKLISKQLTYLLRKYPTV